MELSNKIKQLRIQKGVKQEKLAEAMGVSAQAPAAFILSRAGRTQRAVLALSARKRIIVSHKESLPQPFGAARASEKIY